MTGKISRRTAIAAIITVAADYVLIVVSLVLASVYEPWSMWFWKDVLGILK